jgi:hypothetical protein
MTLTLTRKDFREDGIFSELTDDKGNSLAVTLEHSYDSKPKLYDGTFTCVKGIHRLHDNVPFEAFEVTGVTDHTGILFHVGNYNKDSDGCVLLGTDIADSDQGRMVTHSMIAFSKFMAMLENDQTFTLIVSSQS